MVKDLVTMGDEILEARPFAMLVQEASQYASEVYIEMDGKKINAKSIMGMMTLNCRNGEEITVTANGTDEEKAIEGVRQFLEKQK